MGTNHRSTSDAKLTQIANRIVAADRLILQDIALLRREIAALAVRLQRFEQASAGRGGYMFVFVGYRLREGGEQTTLLKLPMLADRPEPAMPTARDVVAVLAGAHSVPLEDVELLGTWGERAASEAAAGNGHQP